MPPKPWLLTHLSGKTLHSALGWIVFIGALIFIVIIGTAMAHEATNGQPLGWTYSFACCSNQDCKPVAAGEVRETPEGYLLVKTGEVVGYQDTRVKESPDGTFHVCQVAGDFDAGRILCIYAPGRGY